MNYKNSKCQGDAGLGVAIGYFATIGQTVSIPLTDSQCYDLIVDEDGKLKKIQVKTTNYKHPNNDLYQVSLATKGGNRSGTGKTKLFDTELVDYLFVLTGNNEKYLIPASEIAAKAQLSLGKKYNSFLLDN